MNRSLTHSLLGAVLALGAPLGWWVLRSAFAVSGDRALFIYLLLGTALAFASFGAILGRLSDVLANQNGELARLVRTDALTEVANVRAFRERLELERVRSLRSGEPLAMAMVDLDHFKRVNDAHGHAAGDAVLAHTAQVIARSIREIDLVARVGGEEFAILFPGSTVSDAAQIAERVRAALEREPVVVAGASLGVTASFGVAGLEGDGEALMRAADAALYLAKEQGRNRVALAGASGQGVRRLVHGDG